METCGRCQSLFKFIFFSEAFPGHIRYYQTSPRQLYQFAPPIKGVCAQTRDSPEAVAGSVSTSRGRRRTAPRRQRPEGGRGLAGSLQPRRRGRPFPGGPVSKVSSLFPLQGDPLQRLWELVGDSEASPEAPSHRAVSTTSRRKAWEEGQRANSIRRRGQARSEKAPPTLYTATPALGRRCRTPEGKREGGDPGNGVLNTGDLWALNPSWHLHTVTHPLQLR